MERNLTREPSRRRKTSMTRCGYRTAILTIAFLLVLAASAGLLLAKASQEEAAQLIPDGDDEGDAVQPPCHPKWDDGEWARDAD